MVSQKRKFPTEHITVENTITPHTKRFPFYIKKYGYSNAKRFSVDVEYSHSDILLLYTISGVAGLYINTDSKYLAADDLLINACSSPFDIKGISAEKWEYFYIVINGSHAKFYYNIIRDKSNIIRMNPMNHVLDYFIDLSKISFDDSNLSNIQVNTIIQNIMMELYEISFDIVKSKNIIPVQETSINNAMNYIAKHYHEDLSVDTICNKMAFSKYYFCKLFKEHTGITIHQYVNEFRVNKSKELLSYSKLPINAVAAAVGFQNPLTYIRCFKRSTQMTPSEYRENF
ncbi:MULTISPECIES: helix-turn-helix domain-containing protein [Clostridiaceae]|uniref:Helix-turn-helix transcriptional regulator n=1 Tax=Clostridium facile TaxID=2763035 RepID=A0ABR7IS33_9CLOT|nr:MULTISPECIES: AraC family transcriptional regulator [Clostridiaceae]MBC5787844.1 helix-turn-helix transcriptional regulator [Clostridium facile]